MGEAGRKPFLMIHTGATAIGLAFIHLLIGAVIAPAAAPLGEFTSQKDVGGPALKGAAVHDPESETYTLSGAGKNMWLDRDEFHFVYKRTRGDFILRARVQFLGQGVDAHRKLGWMARSSLDADSPHVNAVTHGDGLTSLQFRRAAGQVTEEVKSTLTDVDVIQLERRADRYTMSVARFGQPFVAAQLDDLKLGDELYIGLFVCSHNPEVIERALFKNVRVTIPAAEDFIPYRDYIGSRLETLNVNTGNRRVLFNTPEAIEAPNWTPDNAALIYNSKGRLFRFPISEKRPIVLDTGFATRCNNDHVISPDGKTLAISHQPEETGGKSLIYTMPARGGEPKQVTANAPSYLHGWSPDGQYLVYTGERNGDFDIYRISIDGGEETRLTTAKGLDDGPEYSPDGKYIYFNSARTGTMQLYRMKPDGADQEQLTHDDLNNWFPHVSPDGKRIAFLSFSKDIAPNDHPYYKHIYLRMMPIDGDAPQVIAYVYGGQGTINVPSWAPDSQHLSFVSNTNFDNGEFIEISAEALKDKIHGGLLGQLLGNLNGLPHEMKYIHEPGNVESYTPGLPQGAQTDDDTDIEWVYITAMERRDKRFLSPEEITELWKKHINRRIWCSNAYARNLMDLGVEPPLTGNRALNPWAEFNISGQFLCESFGLVAPGMPQTAARLGAHYTRVGIEGEPAQTTQVFTTMIATAFFTKNMDDILDAGVRAADPRSVIPSIVADVRRWHKQNPKEWRQTRQLVKEKYTKHDGTTRDRNGYELNTASIVAALLYGDGDFAQTLRIAFNFGWDADCNAATAATIMGAIEGYQWMKEQGWIIKDVYQNTTRDDMPQDETISRFADRLFKVAERVIQDGGGEKIERNGHSIYRVRVQKAKNIESFVSADIGLKKITSEMSEDIKNNIAGNPNRQSLARSAYLAICLDQSEAIRLQYPEQWSAALAALETYPKLVGSIYQNLQTPAAEQLRTKAKNAGLKKP